MDYRKRIRDEILLAAPDGVGAEAGNVGTAIDHRLRLAFTADPTFTVVSTALGLARLNITDTSRHLPKPPAWWANLVDTGNEAVTEILHLADHWKLADRELPIARDRMHEEGLARLLVVGT